MSTAKKNAIDGWKEGLHLQTESGRSVQQLLDRVASDRLRFGASLIQEAERLLRENPPLYRAAVSRSYYAMYHAMRAAAFIYHGGDDHQEHRTLPAQAPADMNDTQLWSNALKDAREYRNAADYDPYPKSKDAWKKTAESLLPTAKKLLQEVRTYLKARGVQYL